MSNADSLWSEAIKAHGEGRFDAASDLSRQVLAIRPHDLQARMMVGIAAVKLGHMAEARSAFEDLLAIQPRAYPAYVWLALIADAEENPDEALRHALQAAELEPRDPEVLSTLGSCLLATQDYEGARLCFERATGANPANAGYQFGLAMANEGLRRLPETLKALRRAVKLAPNPVWLYRLGLLEAIAGNLVKARTVAERLLAMSPDQPEAHHLMGRVLQETGEPDEARRHYLRALEMNPDFEVVLALLGMQYQSLGRFDEAIDAFRRAVEVKPDQGSAYHGIVSSKKVDPDDRRLVDQMEIVASQGNLDHEERTMIEFALGKAYHDLTDPEKAMAHYDMANRGSALINFHGQVFDRTTFSAEIDDSIRLFSRDFIASQTGGSDSGLPIFIVGMIRSGTTLMEHILSCHPNIGAAGEVDFWASRDRQIVNYANGRMGDTLQASIDEYVQILASAAPGKLRVTDKNPANVLNVGLLHVAFPRAKIIHMRRNPVDTFLSIYMTAIRTPPPFACDKENIVFAYREYLRAIEHWRAVLPTECFIEIDYEELVSDQVNTTRAVLERLGLPWNDECARPEKNPRAVRTPSLWQVRQPIHTESIAKWKAYEPWLGPFAEFLEAR